MNHAKLFSRSIITVLCAALMLHTIPVYSAGTNTEELRHEAFLRGGNAIRAALNAKSYSEPLAGKNVAKAIPATPPAVVPQEKAKTGGMSKAAWVALIAGFTASGILIHHFATAPGASVTNCSTCK